MKENPYISDEYKQTLEKLESESPAQKPKRKRTPRKPAGRRPARIPGAKKLPGSTAVRLVDVTLTARHGINGINYGPGVARVREDVAAVLREQEQRRKKERDRFYQTDRAVIVGRGKRLYQVPYETFDDSFGGAVPVGTVNMRSGKVGGF